MSDRRRRFGGLKDIIHDNVRQGLSAGWSVLGDLVKPAKQLIDDEPIIILQCGKVVMENTPRRMRTELWMSSLHRKGVGVAAAGKYEDMLMHKSISDEAASDIDKDLARTFPSMRRFASQEGQEALRRILLAYAAYDPEVGYCQGMNFVAGLLLMYLPERHAFGGLVVLMQDRGLRKYYSTDMSLLQTHLWQLGRLMPQRLCAHLEACGVLPLLYGAGWLMTCFSADFPASFSARVMDVIMADKMDQALLKAAVGLLKRCEQQMLQMRDMEEILQLLKLQLPNWDESLLHDVLTDAFKTPWSPQQLQLLGSTEGAESVAEALERVHRENHQQAAGDAGDADAASTPTAAARQARVSAVGSPGSLDSTDGVSAGSSSTGGAAAAAAIRLMPPPSPRPLSRHPTQRESSSSDQVISQGHEVADMLVSEPHAAHAAEVVGFRNQMDLQQASVDGSGGSSNFARSAPDLRVLAPAAAADAANGVELGLLIDMSSPRASLDGSTQQHTAAAAAQTSPGELHGADSDWSAFVESPASGATVQPVHGADWDPFGVSQPHPSELYQHSSSSSKAAEAHKAGGSAAGADRHISAAAVPSIAANSRMHSHSSSELEQLQQHRQMNSHSPQHHHQQRQQHSSQHQLRQQLEELSFSQLSTVQTHSHHQHMPGHPLQQDQQQQQQQLGGQQPSVKGMQVSSTNKPHIQAPIAKQGAADDDWWDFQSSPMAHGHQKHQHR